MAPLLYCPYNAGCGILIRLSPTGTQICSKLVASGQKSMPILHSLVICQLEKICPIFSRDSDLTTTNVSPWVSHHFVKSSLNQSFM